MRLLDEDSDRSFSRLTVLLTRAEAVELRDSVEALLKSAHGHEHISSEDFGKEITIAIYGDDSFLGFAERVQRLIRDDQ